jgi:hypothetical protein
MTNEAHPDLVALDVGTDVGTIEVILARLRADGIPVTVDPDLSSLSALDEEAGGFQLLVRREDVEATLPVLRAAGIEAGG